MPLHRSAPLFVSFHNLKCNTLNLVVWPAGKMLLQCMCARSHHKFPGVLWPYVCYPFSFGSKSTRIARHDYFLRPGTSPLLSSRGRGVGGWRSSAFKLLSLPCYSYCTYCASCTVHAPSVHKCTAPKASAPRRALSLLFPGAVFCGDCMREGVVENTVCRGDQMSWR